MSNTILTLNRTQVFTACIIREIRTNSHTDGMQPPLGCRNKQSLDDISGTDRKIEWTFYADNRYKSTTGNRPSYDVTWTIMPPTVPSVFSDTDVVWVDPFNTSWFVRELINNPTLYCINCGLSVGQCRDLFFSWRRLSSCRGWTAAVRHSPAFQHISDHDCSQWWTPPLGLPFPRQSSSTPLHFFVSSTGWRLQSGLHFNGWS